MLQVAVVGSHCPDQLELLTHLKTADYTVSVYESFSEYPQDSQDAPVAVIVYGADIGLDPIKAVKLLKSNTILLLFSPSNNLLQCIKNEIGTVLDLPRIKLEDGTPLIIYRLHATDRFHFVPGFSLGSSEDGTPKASYSELLEYSVKLIAECISHAREVNSGKGSYNLEPPTGTRYYKADSFSLVVSPFYGHVNWRVQLHCYATNAIPDKDFTSKGGKVYVVLTHSGQWDFDIRRVFDFDREAFKLNTTIDDELQIEAQWPQGVDWPRLGSEHSKQCSNLNPNTMFEVRFSQTVEPEPE